MWPSRHRSGAPGFAADKRGLYRDQHGPGDPDPDLLMAEKHKNSTQFVVRRFKRGEEMKFSFRMKKELMWFQGSDHAYYTSKVYGPGDAPAKDLWVNIQGGQWKVLRFLSNSHRHAEVGFEHVTYCNDSLQ